MSWYQVARKRDLARSIHTAMAKYASYVICTSPRSGSTLLCNLLTATGVAGNPGSWFHDPSISDWLDYFDLTPDASLSERDVLAAIFQAATAKGSQEKGVFGLRLQRHSFDFFRQKLAVLHTGFSNDAQRFQAAFGRTLFVHLTRHDKIEQAVSYVKASQSGLWHAAPDGTELERLSPPRDPVYDAVEIRARLEEMTAYDQGWERWFAREQINPLRITYESLSEHPIETLRQILNSLGLNPGAATGLEAGTAKLADRTSQNWMARFYSETGIS